MGVEIGGIVGLLVFIVMVYAVVNVVQSGAGLWSKVGWVLVLLLLPILGLLLWIFFGPRRYRG